jgi:hypothetical protein
MNPFPGLRPFTQQEDYLFFGREEQTLELLQRLGSYRFVAVVGTSGSGKSSLVRCGLLSELLGGKMLAAGASWQVAVTHPGGNPLGLLTEALLGAGLYEREREDSRENLLATLSRSNFGLVEAVKQAGLGEGTNFGSPADLVQLRDRRMQLQRRMRVSFSTRRTPSLVDPSPCLWASILWLSAPACA